MKERVALLSVFDKADIVGFAQALIGHGFKIYASGGTFKYLSENGVAVLPVANLVGGEAILGHRVVTLSREVHAGLLAKNTEADIAELASLAIPRIDLVCVDMYPLQAEIAKSGSTRESVIEMIDIGGPTMIRSGAKGGRIVICDPKDRALVISWLNAGSPDNYFVRDLAAKGEFTVAKYCEAAARYLSTGKYIGLFGERVIECRYGENAWQAPAYLYSSGTDDPLALDKFVLVEGMPLGYNNLLDIERALQTVTHLMAVKAKNFQYLATYMVAVGVKHGNACGAALGNDPSDIFHRTMAGDPMAIFGGLLMTTFPFSEYHAEALAGKKLDAIVAPNFSKEVIGILRRKNDKCRFVTNPALVSLDQGSLDTAERFRYVRGGILVQPNYTFVPSLSDGSIKICLGKASQSEECDMMLAWAIGSTSNSNTITLVKDGQLIGNGVGQQDRVGAAKLAIDRANRAGHSTAGASAYSDSFFPFPDGPQALIDAGITAIFTSSGSFRDNETIKVCADHNIALYMIPDKVGRGFFGH